MFIINGLHRIVGQEYASCALRAASRRRRRRLSINTRHVRRRSCPPRGRLFTRPRKNRSLSRGHAHPTDKTPHQTLYRQ